MAIASYITGIGHIGLPTRDMDATLAFYKGWGFPSIGKSKRKAPFCWLF